MVKFVIAVILVVAGVVGWYIYCPQPVMKDFHAAVDSGKPEAILPFLDMPSLKKSTYDFVKARYSRPDVPGGEMKPEDIQAIVDSFLTPANVILLMKGAKISPGSAAAGPPDDPKNHPIDEHYQSPQVYSIDVYLSPVLTPDNKVSFLFERDGWFDWKLAAFRFSWS